MKGSRLGVRAGWSLTTLSSCVPSGEHAKILSPRHFQLFSLSPSSISPGYKPAIILSAHSPGHIWTDSPKLWINPLGQCGKGSETCVFCSLMNGMHMDPSSWHIDRTNWPCRGVEISSRLTSLWTPATSARKMPVNFQARTWGNLTERQLWECGSSDVSGAYILSCLWKRLQLSSFDTVSGGSVSSMFCCTVGTHQMSVLKNFRSCQGKPCSEVAEFVWFSHCHICLPPTCRYFFKSCDHLFFPSPLCPLPRTYFFGFCLHYFSFNVSKIKKKNVGKKNLDFYLVPHFRCKDSYSIDSKLFLLRGISFCFCAILCMNLGTRRSYCDIINPYCYLKMIVCRTEDFHWCEAQFNE